MGPTVKNGFDFNKITVPFRLILPIMFGGYMYAYQVDQGYIKKSFEDIKTAQGEMKSSQKNIWENMRIVSDKENKDMLCLTRGLYQCCGEKASTNC